jgi:hypothetical protein
MRDATFAHRYVEIYYLLLNWHWLIENKVTS